MICGRYGWSERDQGNAITYYRGILPARLLEVPRIMSIHNNATKHLIPYDDFTVWDTGASIPFHSAYFFYFTYKCSHTDQYILFCWNKLLCFPLSFTHSPL